MVTGAASGIGEATARLFAAEGASVLLADVDAGRGRRLASELGERAVFVPADVSREAARVMRPQGYGSIINTSSVAAFRANYAGHDYSAAEAAIRQLTVTTANELGEHGVRVNAVCPGAVATAIYGRAAGLDSEAARRTVDFMTAALSETAPIRRAGQRIDIAEAVLWLASDSSAFVNGQSIVVDGGLLTGTPRRNRPASSADLLALLRQAAQAEG